MNVTLIIIYVFALAFACFEAWKGSTNLRPASWGWTAVVLLIAAQIFFHGYTILVKP